jgi:hypothetical protein
MKKMNNFIINDNVYKCYKMKLEELSTRPRVVDAEVRVKALQGLMSKERKGKTNNDGLYGILGANSGYHDIHIHHPIYNDINMTWKIEHNPECIPGIFR